MKTYMSRITGWAVLITMACLGLLIIAVSFSPTAQAGVTTAPVGGVPSISIVQLASGLNEPLNVTHAGDERLFVAGQPGTIQIVQPDGTVLPTLFLDITDRVEYGPNTEQGFLGLAFDPDYTSNGYFYVNYTYCSVGDCPDFGNTPNLYTRISRFSVSADPNVADPNSELVLMTIQQPYGEHNGGDINFGPDGYLYIGVGDGGNENDPENRSQNPMELLGKMLRIDVDASGLPADCDGSGQYTIPADNPFVDGAGGTCDEIWALGLRNPWQFSFDRQTGDLYIGEVGEQDWEEINFQPAASSGGENWGWRCYEGNDEHITTGCGPIEDYDFPAYSYEQTTVRCAVMGGFVYRGGQFPVFSGHYIFADYCKGDVWTMINDGGWTATLQGDLGNKFTAFGEGADGEIYMVARSPTNGFIFHVIENTEMTTPTPTPTATPPIHLTPVATGFTEPVDVENAGDTKLFVAERGGLVHEVADDGTINPTPFLDISDRVQTGFWQQGLLSIAFHPAFANNGYLYAHYTDLNGDIVIARFTHSGTLTTTQTIDPSTEFPILTADHPNTSDENNGGELAFGPDGYLYISLGDGGDPDTAQDIQSVFGKILRIDVDGGSPYAIPPDNPFVGVTDAREEIWALGLRNPWRYSFDSETGDMYIGDVGDLQIEEVDTIPTSSLGGENFGWSCYEGSLQGPGYDPGACTATYIPPLHEYDHTVGSVIVGGYVYRNCQYGDMEGKYYFADYDAGKLWNFNSGQATLLITTPQQISSFGQGYDGELYMLGYDLGNPNGTLYHLAGNWLPSCDNVWVPIISKQ